MRPLLPLSEQRFQENGCAGTDGGSETVGRLALCMADRVGELQSWETVKLLTVRVNRLRDWSSTGLLCISDAAHAMSPIDRVGINLAIQSAVATANLLGDQLRCGRPSDQGREQEHASYRVASSSLTGRG